MLNSRKFDWMVLQIGSLHMEMNMVKAFIPENWEDASKCWEWGKDGQGMVNNILSGTIMSLLG